MAFYSLYFFFFLPRQKIVVSEMVQIFGGSTNTLNEMLHAGLLQFT